MVGFYDSDTEKAKLIAAETGVKAYPTYSDLLADVDAIDIVTPTPSHFDCAMQALDLGKHFFIEKPITETVEEAEMIVKRVAETGLKAQVGHVERFNPAFLAAKEFASEPMFIEAHRLAEFKPRGTDVPVVLDLMIHDIDILLSLVNSPVETVSASGVSVISDNVDIANARIEFENGCVANLTSSRVSLKTERKMRIFQKNTYLTLDFHKKEVSVFKLRELGDDEKSNSPFVIDPGNGRARKEVSFVTPKMPETNAIKMELELFAQSIINNTVPEVTVNQGYQSLVLAHKVLDKIEEQLQKSKQVIR